MKTMIKKYEDIDLALEKIIFLENAEEGNPGIYHLTWEYGQSQLTIEDKYKIARKVLTELIQDGLVTLDKYSDLTLSDKIETIDKHKVDDILNNPSYWYPCNEILSISLTKKGEEFLNNEAPKYADKINERLGGLEK